MTYETLRNSVLEHHGVKGMRWGVRKPKYLIKKAKGRGPGLFSSLGQDFATSAQNKRDYYNWQKRVMDKSSMTNKDLQRYTTRLRLENQLQEQLRNSRMYINPMNTNTKGYKDPNKSTVEQIGKTVNKGIITALKKYASPLA